MSEETVRDALMEANKLPHVVRELLFVELWREEVLPRILDLGEPATSFQVFFNRLKCTSINMIFSSRAT